MRSLLSQKVGRVRLGASLGLSVGVSLCAGALVVGPLATPVWAAPTIGGDENGPQVQILKPAYQDVLKGKTPILIAVKVQKFNPQFVELFVDDKPATEKPLPFSNLPSALYNWDTKVFPDGPHKLTVRVTDTQGFRGWAEVNVFINNQRKVDTIPPSLKWQNTTSFQQLSGTASIQLEALDNFGVKWLFISLSKASDPTQKLRQWMLNRPPYTVKLDTTQVPDGVYQLSAKAYDSFEQEGEATALTIGIVNSLVNATTVGDMLAGLQRVEASNRKPAASPPKPGRRFTVDAPETDAARVAPKVSRSGAGSASNGTSNATSNAAPKAVAPRFAAPSATKPGVVVKPGLSIPKTTPALSLPPTLPPMIVRDLPRANQATKAAKATRPQIAKLAPPLQPSAPLSTDEIEVAAPQLSPQTPLQTRPALSGIESEIDGAMSEDWRARFARSNAPDAAPRAEDGASMTGQTPIAAPSWSQNDALDTSRRVALAPLKVETESEVPGGRTSLPELLARADVGQSEVSTPQLGAPDAAPEPKISAREAVRGALGAKIDALKAARAGKSSTPATPRVAALPRTTGRTARGAANSITVSPLQVNLSDALPAFHTAARTSDLRAVAARYGLPVEVIAANNGWTSDKTLAPGERVKLPKQLKVALRGVPVTGDAPSMLVGGVGVTAFRFMFEQAGGKMIWDAKKQRVIARKGGSEVVLSIGSNRAKVGDKDVMLELAAFLFEGRTMVPLRFFEAGLRAEVEWDPQTGRLVVAMAN